MIKKVIIAGFGGQGIILSGKLLAYSAMHEGNEVSHIPSYGAEMRGGTCNCSVVISDKKISSPVITKPDIVLIFNQPSKIKFEPRCLTDAYAIVNSSLIDSKLTRNDINSYYVDATNIAVSLGNTRCTNMVMLGALAKATGIIKLETMINSLKDVISARHSSLIDINTKALKQGYESL